MQNSRIKILLKLSKQAFGKYKPQILVLTILGFLSGLLEGIGINAVIPLFSFAIGGKNAANDIISRYIEKFFLFINIDFSIKYILIFIVLLFILKAIVLIISDYIKSRITLDYEERTRSNLFNKTLRADWDYLLKQKVGYLENVLMADIGIGASLLSKISIMIMMLTSLLIYTLVAINISFSITLITLVLGSMLFLVLKRFIYKTRKMAGEVTRINKYIAHHINENIIGLKTVKTASVGEEVAAIGRGYFKKIRDLKLKLFLLKNVTGSLIQPVSLIFVCVLFAVSYKMPNFNFAALIAIIYLIQRIFQYGQKLQSGLHAINESIPYLQNALNYEEQAAKRQEKTKGKYHFQFNQSLEFKNVSFSYGFKKAVLSNINFRIAKGEMVGLVGASGAGKTTVMDLILRLFEPSGGRILLDGGNIAEINLKEWRDNIGYVSQDIFLINDTIANNIKFYDNSISDEEIAEAAKMANIYNFIQGTEQKFETIIGERGIFLSAGQRQRIVIARILARKPQLLILDEATSALDNESELKIKEVIDNLKGKITILAIAHRLTTVVNSDRLIVLENGKIIEEGRPKKLLEDKESYFSKIYNIRK